MIKSKTFYSKDSKSYTKKKYSHNSITGTKWRITVNNETGAITETLIEINTNPEKNNYEDIEQFVTQFRGW